MASGVAGAVRTIKHKLCVHCSLSTMTVIIVSIQVLMRSVTTCQIEAAVKDNCEMEPVTKITSASVIHMSRSITKIALKLSQPVKQSTHTAV